jgi:hypothetical protein
MKKNFRAFQVKKNGSSSWINRIVARKIFKTLEKILLIDEHIVKDSHILKLNILGCDRTTPLKQNLVPRFARVGGKDES